MREDQIIPWMPWQGKKYSITRLLILGESAYSWERDGKVIHPDASHPKIQLQHWMENFGEQKFFTAMGRALSGKEAPTYGELERAWNDYAYSIFVQGTVGVGANKRPTHRQFAESKTHFRILLEELRPTRVIVVGKTMWNRHMPGCEGPHRSDDLQAYKLSDGTLAWCMAIPHPSNRTQGFRWEEIGEKIREFRSAKLPSRG
jgi:hypothetical protein